MSIRSAAKKAVLYTLIGAMGLTALSTIPLAETILNRKTEKQTELQVAKAKEGSGIGKELGNHEKGLIFWGKMHGLGQNCIKRSHAEGNLDSDVAQATAELENDTLRANLRAAILLLKGTKCSLLDNNQSWFDAVSRGTAKFKVYSDWADSGGYSNCDTTFLSKNILRSNPAYIAAAIVHENGHAISTSEESSSFSINLIRIIKKIIDWESAAVLYLLQKPVLPIMQTNPEQWISGSFFGWQSASEKTANYYAIRFMSDAKQGDLLAASEGILARKKLLNYTYGLELQDANYEKIASGVAGVFWGGALLLHALAAGALLSLGRFFSKLAGAAVKGLRNENPQLPASPI